jgi:sugar lactone lactonase YvrE
LSDVPSLSPIPVPDIRFVGRGLRRPECVVCGRDGTLYASDWRGGVALIGPDGAQRSILPRESLHGVQPNGIAVDRDGSFLLANLGEAGGVWRLRRDGTLEPFSLEVAGAALPPTNFVMVDRDGGVWITVSTRLRPRALGYRPDACDGFVVRVDEGRARVVADGLGFTNEVQIDAGGDWLYVNETFGRRLSRFRLESGGGLGARETVATFGAGTFPDGLTFDAEGGIWITSIVSNRVIRVDPAGGQTVMIEDADPGKLEEIEETFLQGRLGRHHLDTGIGTRLQNISSLAFGGEDLRTAYLGCLLGDSIATFRAPLPGLPPTHWDWT